MDAPCSPPYANVVSPGHAHSSTLGPGHPDPIPQQWAVDRDQHIMRKVSALFGRDLSASVDPCVEEASARYAQQSARDVLLSDRVTKYDPSLTVGDVNRMREEACDSERGRTKQEMRLEAKRLSALKSRIVRKQKLELFAGAQSALTAALRESRDTEQLALGAAYDSLTAFRGHFEDYALPLPDAVYALQTRLADLSEQIEEKNRRMDETLAVHKISTWRQQT